MSLFSQTVSGQLMSSRVDGELKQNKAVVDRAQRVLRKNSMKAT